MDVLRAGVCKLLPVQPDSKDFKRFASHIVSVAYSFFKKKKQCFKSTKTIFSLRTL